MTGNETWVYHYDPENKSLSVEYCYKGSPTPKKFKTAGKVKLAIFWNTEGVVLTDFVGKGAILNLERWIENLKSLKNASQGRGQKLMMSYFNKTMPGLAQVPPQLIPFHVCGLQCYHIWSATCILLLSISTCSPN